MILTRAYKTEIDPNAAQRQRLVEHAGTARWVYNWALRRKIDAYAETGKHLSYVDLSRDLVQLKCTEVRWLSEISSTVPTQALRDLDVAFKNFFTRCTKGEAKRGFPRFKSRHKRPLKFRLTGNVKARSRAFFLPSIGWVRLKEKGYIPTQAFSQVSVSEKAGHWFISVFTKVEVPDPTPPQDGGFIGVDVGVAKLATLSDGTVFENPRALRARERKLAHLQRDISRKMKGSNNRKKAKTRVAVAHYKVSCVRKDAIHKATSALIAKAPRGIGIETLNIAGMKKNRCLAKAVDDTSMGEFLRQVKYKAVWAGIPVVEADRWYPSTKTCSGCGVKRDMPLGERTFRCAACGLELDRDLNAALNLRTVAASSAVKACGGDVSLLALVPAAAPMKQESKAMP